MVQQRLQIGGAAGRTRQTQFGFQPRRSTVQAISIARRMFDAAHALASPGSPVITFDWAKAFDVIKHGTLLEALGR
eukprot:9382359-Pyramimonas_sp.AAC.1